MEFSRIIFLALMTPQNIGQQSENHELDLSVVY